MVQGIQMSASHDHTLSPAHGHLNLVGFASMAVLGTYDALTPDAARSRLSFLHFAVATVTTLILTPGIALAIAEKGEILAQIGSVLAVISMGLFLAAVVRHGVGGAKSLA